MSVDVATTIQYTYLYMSFSWFRNREICSSIVFIKSFKKQGIGL